MKPTKFDAVGVNVKVYLDAEDDWFEGIIEEYHPKRGYHIQLFDGQDLWMDSLNDKVQFEEEFETGEIDVIGDNTLKSSTGFVENELDILDEDDYVIDGVTTDNKLTVPDYHSHQEYNQRSIRADLTTLPTRGILLTGSVLGTAGLVMDEAMEGELFFKVLFVEGGSQPAMFRCKTPIYTSDPIACSLSDPRWENARFQFDMIMPLDEANDKQAPFGFKIQGEIIIAVYMSRNSGGSSLLGQAAFQLRDAVETGTVEFFASGVEGRSITGAHTLLSRAGEVSGEIDVQLNIAWKSLVPQVTSSISQSRLLRGSSGAGALSRPASAAPTPNKTGQSTASKTATGAGLPPKRPVSATMKGTVAPVRTIVSNIQRKQREDAARIARENAKLQHNLQQHANRNGRTSPTTTPAGTAYGPQTAASVAAGARTYHGASSEAEAKSAGVAGAGGVKSSGASAKSNDTQSIDTLLKLYNDLKRAVALDEQENVRLKSKVGKLKVSVKQAEMSVTRIRSQPSNGASSGDSKAKSVGSVRSSKESLYSSDPKEAPRSSASRLPTAQAKAFSGDTVVKAGAYEYIPFFEPLNDDELKAQNINDDEYTSMAEEYRVLQSARRGVLDRTRVAQLACDEAAGVQSTAEERMEMIRRRVLYYKDIAGKLVVGEDLGIGGARTGLVGAGAKGAAPVSDADHDDYVLFDRLRDGKQEYEVESALYEANLHSAAHVSAMEELLAVRDFLSDKCNGAESRIATLKNETDRLHQELRRAMLRGPQPTYLEQVSKARAAGESVLNKEAAARLLAAQKAISTVEHELQDIQSRRESRRNSLNDYTLSPDQSVVH